MECEFELPDGSYSMSDIQDYIEYIIKKHETLTTVSLIFIYLFCFMYLFLPCKLTNVIIFKYIDYI